MVCDPSRAANNGSADCQDGLVCIPASQLGTDSARCCPGETSLRTGVCATGQTTVATNSAPPCTLPDGGPCADASADASDGAEALDATSVTDGADGSIGPILEAANQAVSTPSDAAAGDGAPE